jgi:uncharacterized membrane protein
MKSRTLSLAATMVFFGLISLSYSQSFVYSNGRYTAFNGPTGSGHTYAYGLNNFGQIVGAYNNTVGFLYSGGTYATLPNPSPNPEFFAAYGVNDEGKIVGTYVNNALSAQYGFLYSGGHYTTIMDPLATAFYTNAFGINDLGQIVGDFGNPGLGVGFLYSNGTYETISDPLGTAYSAAFGINNSGEIVGQYATGSSEVLTGLYGFLYKNRTYTTISVPGAIYTYAQGINDIGQIVGWYSNNLGDYGFVYSDGAYKSLALDADAYGINDFGQIVGPGTPMIPEPSTWTMMLIGLAGLGVAMTRTASCSKLESARRRARDT